MNTLGLHETMLLIFLLRTIGSLNHLKTLCQMVTKQCRENIWNLYLYRYCRLYRICKITLITAGGNQGATWSKLYQKIIHTSSAALPHRQKRSAFQGPKRLSWHISSGDNFWWTPIWTFFTSLVSGSTLLKPPQTVRSYIAAPPDPIFRMEPPAYKVLK